MRDNTPYSKQPKPTNLVSLFDVESLDANLFRYADLQLLWGKRGIYGGQVVSQAIMAATKTVDSTFHLHSLHCYFLLSGVRATIFYTVDRVRNGRSYSARAVRAVQNGKTIFVMLCSFQKPEPWQPVYRSPMPKVPAPEESETLQAYFWKRAKEETDEWTKRHYTARARVREESPIQVRIAAEDSRDGYFVQCHWMQAVTLQECDAAYQKAVLGYISDLFFLEAGSSALGLRESSEEGADVAAFSTTIDHAVWYYSDDFDCSEWLMFESRVPQAGSGRVIIHRRVFTRDGAHIANFSQEGVMRAKVSGAEEPKKVETKL